MSFVCNPLFKFKLQPPPHSSYIPVDRQLIFILLESFTERNKLAAGRFLLWLTWQEAQKHPETCIPKMCCCMLMMNNALFIDEDQLVCWWGNHQQPNYKWLWSAPWNALKTNVLFTHWKFSLEMVCVVKSCKIILFIWKWLVCVFSSSDWDQSFGGSSGHHIRGQTDRNVSLLFTHSHSLHSVQSIICQKHSFFSRSSLYMYNVFLFVPQASQQLCNDCGCFCAIMSVNLHLKYLVWTSLMSHLCWMLFLKGNSTQSKNDKLTTASSLVKSRRSTAGFDCKLLSCCRFERKHFHFESFRW